MSMEWKEVTKDKYSHFLKILLQSTYFKVNDIPEGTLIIYDEFFEDYANSGFQKSVYNSLNGLLKKRREGWNRRGNSYGI